jgi:hypothetical protein
LQSAVFDWSEAVSNFPVGRHIFVGMPGLTTHRMWIINLAGIPNRPTIKS